jgi:hypothetical protein
MKTKIQQVSQLTVAELIEAGAKGIKVALANSSVCTVKKTGEGFSVFVGRCKLYSLSNLDNVKFCLALN